MKMEIWLFQISYCHWILLGSTVKDQIFKILSIGANLKNIGSNRLHQLIVCVAFLNLLTERNTSMWIPRSDAKQVHSKIRKFFEENQPNMYMWTGIERFDANKFLINGKPIYAPKFFNHTDKVWMNFV